MGGVESTGLGRDRVWQPRGGSGGQGGTEETGARANGQRRSEGQLRLGRNLGEQAFLPTQFAN